MAAQDPSRENASRRLELLIVCTFCAMLLAALAVLVVAKRGGFLSTPAAEYATENRLVAPIDINTATWPEFATLPGIGEKRAKAIIALRERKKGFRSVDELAEVAGIGENAMKQIRPLVTVGPPPAAPETTGD